MWMWKFICWLIRRLTRRPRRASRFLRLREALDQELAQLGDRWITHYVRLKTPLPPVEITKLVTRVGVVLQGQVMTQEDFTLRSLEHYRKTFPGCPIYVSTWTDESTQVIRALEKAGAVVIVNDRPRSPGPGRLNRRIRSTQAGIQAARDSGCRYVLTTRSDARLYAANIPDFVAGLLEQFPPSPGWAVAGRLAVLDWATRLYVPQHPSELMMFGHIDDMANYWSAPLCDAPNGAYRKAVGHVAEILKPLAPEVYLCRHYLSKLGYPFEPTVASWWQCLADLFVVVDRASIEHFWLKGNDGSDHHDVHDDHQRNETTCGFREWLGIAYASKSPPIEIEDARDDEAPCVLRPATVGSEFAAA